MIDVSVNRKMSMAYILSGFMNNSSIRNIIIMNSVKYYEIYKINKIYE